MTFGQWCSVTGSCSLLVLPASSDGRNGLVTRGGRLVMTGLSESNSGFSRRRFLANMFVLGTASAFGTPSTAVAEPTPAKTKMGSVQASSKRILVTQVDITEKVGDNLSLKAEDWIKTIPMNSVVPDPQAMGLPPVGASEDEVYRIAERLSRIRESIQVPDDGVYCPICHIANVNLTRLRTPCPKCGRQLLEFGWD